MPKKNKSKVRLLLLAMLVLAIAAAVYRMAREPGSGDITPVTALHPVVAEKQAQLTAEAKKIGIEILITDGLRTIEEQDALYRKGREDEGSIVTTVKGGDSYHNYGLAIDYALLNGDGEAIWDLEYDGNGNGRSDWTEVAEIGKSLGFEWGGDWESFKDYPHLQMDFGYSIWELKRGIRPKGTVEEP